MATITITIPDNQVARVVDAMCLAYGYRADDGDRVNFVKARLMDHLRQIVAAVEVAQLERDARATMQKPVDLSLT